MKESSKKGLLVGVFLGITTFCLEAVEVEVKFQLADDEIVSLPLAVAQKSETLAGLIDDLSLSGKTQVELDKEENTIPLTNITSGQWNDIAAILTKISKNENVEEYLNRQTLVLTINDYVNLLNSLNYLDISQGLQVAFRKFVDFIQKNVQVILKNEKDKNLLRQLPINIKEALIQQFQKLGMPAEIFTNNKALKFNPYLLSWSLDNQKLIASSFENDKAVAWNVADKKEIFTLEFNDAVWSPDGKSIAGTFKNALLIKPLTQEGLPSQELRSSFIFVTGVESLAWSPDSEKLAIAFDDASVSIWQASDLNNTFNNFQIKGGNIDSFAWSPDSKKLVFLVKKNVQIWDVASGKIFSSFDLSTRSDSVAWSPDGKKLLLGSFDSQTIKIFDIEKKSVINTIKASVSVRAVGWSPDGSRLALVSDNGLLIWDSASFQLLYTLEGRFESMAWSRDSNKIAGGYKDFVKVWEFTFSPELQKIVDVLRGSAEQDQQNNKN